MDSVLESVGRCCCWKGMTSPIPRPGMSAAGRKEGRKEDGGGFEKCAAYPVNYDDQKREPAVNEVFKM